MAKRRSPLEKVIQRIIVKNLSDGKGKKVNYNRQDGLLSSAIFGMAKFISGEKSETKPSLTGVSSKKKYRKLTFEGLASDAILSIAKKITGEGKEKNEPVEKNPLFLNKTTKKIQTIKNNETLADALGKLYIMFEIIVKQNQLDGLVNQRKQREQKDTIEKRHNEILNTLKKLSKVPDERTILPEKIEKSTKQKTKKKPVKVSAKQKLPEEQKPTIEAPKIPEVPEVPAPKIPKIPSATQLPKSVAPPVAGFGLSALLYKGEAKTYETQFGGKQVPNLQDMTINEVLQYQKKEMLGKGMGSTAIGKYQIMDYTLEGAKKSMHLSGNEKFDKNMQDKIYQQFLTGSKRPLLNAYLSGKSNDIDAAQLDLAQEFASVPVPHQVTNNKGIVRYEGQSYYSDSLNKSMGISKADVQAYLKQERDLRTGKITKEEALNSKIPSKIPKQENASTTITGQVINKSSIENMDSKKQMTTKNTAFVNNTTTNIIKPADNNMIVISKKSSSESSFLEKQLLG